MFKSIFEFHEPHWGIEIIDKRFYSSIPKEYYKRIQQRKYSHILKKGVIYSLLLLILFFQFWKQVSIKISSSSYMITNLQVEEIPITYQKTHTVAPTRPAMPIASENEELSDDETIDDTILVLDESLSPPPPPPMDGSMQLFVPYDEPPVPIGGFAAILKNIQYPEIYRKSGVEGMIILRARILEDGSVGEVKVIQSLGIDAFEEEALRAVRSVPWKPAKQRDRKLAVWITVPIEFKIKSID